MELEANAIDSAITFLQVLDKFVDGGGLGFPVVLFGRMVEIIVEKQGSWVSLSRPCERLAHEVIDFVPNAISDYNTRCVIKTGGIHCLVYDVPGDALAGVSSDSLLNVVLYVDLNFCRIRHTAEVVRSYVTRASICPYGCMTSKSLPILFGQLKNGITVSVIKIT